MPFALRHAGTGELLACPQTNGYELAYYGVLLWGEEPEAAEALEALLRAERYAPLEQESGGLGDSGSSAPGGKPRRDRHMAEWEQVQELSRWRPVLLTEHEAKLANVRLKSDPRLRVYLREGRIEAEPAAREP